MESLITERLINSLSNGDTPQFLAYVVIFGLIWLDVKGMKTELKNLNTTVLKSFADGEKRFEKLESDILSFQNRITTLEVNIIRNSQDIKSLNYNKKGNDDGNKSV